MNLSSMSREPVSLQDACLDRLHNICLVSRKPVYMDVRDMLVKMPTHLIRDFGEYLFDVMWDEPDFETFNIYCLCDEIVVQRELESARHVSLFERCRTDVVRMCARLTFEELCVVMTRYPPLMLDQLESHLSRSNWQSVMSRVICTILPVPQGGGRGAGVLRECILCKHV